MYLLDTDIATLLMYGRNERVLRRYRSIPESEIVGLPIVTRIQMLIGRMNAILASSDERQLLDNADRLILTENWLAGFAIQPLTPESVHTFCLFHANRKWKKIGISDLLIASIALCSHATLVTRNTKDFASIPGLRFENRAD